MNEKIILGMVEPYLSDRTITYDEFDNIFDILSLKEQYAVLEILHRNQIEIVEKKLNEESTVAELSKDEDLLVDEDHFEILYDEDLFSDDKSEDEVGNETDFLKQRKNIYISNRTLIRLIQAGDNQAKQDLCVKNRKLVDKCVNINLKVSGNKLDFEDLEQVGMLGMLKAAEKFDLSLGTEFSTYAVWWIKQAITREIDDAGFTIRIPVHKMEQIFKVCRLDSKFMAERDYYKRLEMISLETGYPVVIVEDCLRLYSQFLRSASLDVPIGEDEDTSLGDMLPIEEEVPIEDIVFYHLLREQLEEVLETLTMREQKVLSLRFGLEDGRARTLEEVGHEFNVTRERIRQIEAKALRKLRNPSRSSKLRDYY